MRRLVLSAIMFVLVVSAPACGGPEPSSAADGAGAEGAETAEREDGTGPSLLVQEARAAFVSHEDDRVLLSLTPVERIVEVHEAAMPVVVAPEVLVAEWQKRGLLDAPPQASVVLVGGEGSTLTGRVVLHEPAWDGTTKTLRYTVDVESEGLPAGAYREAAVFIEPGRSIQD